MSEHQTRQATRRGTGIIWTFKGTQQTAMEGITDALEHVYNGARNELKYSIGEALPKRTGSGIGRRLPVFISNYHYGTVVIQYGRPNLDRTTPELATASTYVVFFNFEDRSFVERERFLGRGNNPVADLQAKKWFYNKRANVLKYLIQSAGGMSRQIREARNRDTTDISERVAMMIDGISEVALPHIVRRLKDHGVQFGDYALSFDDFQAKHLKEI